jgi:subtilisin family serine protease
VNEMRGSPMERSYIILLDRAGGYPGLRQRCASAVRRPVELGAQIAGEPPQPKLHRERLTAQELQEIAQEPDFVGAAEIMRTRLLSPLRQPLPPAALEPPSLTANGRGRSAARAQPWGIAAVGADRSKFSGSGVTVAVLDTGIDAGHPAFRNVELVQKDFTGAGNGDRDGHGTHCAGILFGGNVDGVRIGVAPGVRKAFIGKVLEKSGGDSDMLMRGLAWAHEERAHVISMSVGFDFAATLQERLDLGWPGEFAMAVTLEAFRANIRLLDLLLQMLRLQEPFTGGSIVVAAGGNDSRRDGDCEQIVSASPPATVDSVISVGSLDSDSLGRGHCVSSFSNSGVAITAPGRDIISAAVGGGLAMLSGTSVATSHVAGIAALWWQAIRQSDLPANAVVVRRKLLGSAHAGLFSPLVYPAERGAGCAAAPRDGLGIDRARAGDHGAGLAPEVAWGKRDRPPPSRTGYDFEPIAIDFGRTSSPQSGGRRNLC